jgi:UDP-N-acetylmuramoylalanine--D-glutamate ligase
MNRVAILGLGSSGVAAARLALAHGVSVHVSDLRTDANAATQAQLLREAGAEVDLGRHDISRIADTDVVVVSPGIPPTAPVLVGLKERGIGWISEPEFASRFRTGPVIAITGTNGKSTVTVLVAALLRAAGFDAVAGGNVGSGLAPAASELALDAVDADWWVLEMSSFQLADIDQFAPDIGVVTSLAPDHLDRYASVEAYWADKARMFDNASKTSRWVLADQPEVLELPGDAQGERFMFSTGREGSSPLHAFERDGHLTLKLTPDGAEEVLIARDELPLLGQHNMANALAAALTARLAGASIEAICTGLRTAEALPHRMAPVADEGGVLWVDDSKATNVGATLGAVSSLTRPLIVLLGGQDKGESMAPLAEALMGRAQTVVCFGAAGARIANELERAWSALEAAAAPTLVRAEKLADAVAVARRHACPGDLVLLSPACSSFDEFDNYVHRGHVFAELAQGVAA